MNKRDRFIAQLRKAAKARGLTFKVETWRGKGGHAMVWIGDKVTTVPGAGDRPEDRAQDQKGAGS